MESIESARSMDNQSVFIASLKKAYDNFQRLLIKKLNTFILLFAPLEVFKLKPQERS